jgi:hypothetical protein
MLLRRPRGRYARACVWSHPGDAMKDYLVSLVPLLVFSALVLALLILFQL